MAVLPGSGSIEVLSQESEILKIVKELEKEIVVLNESAHVLGARLLPISLPSLPREAGSNMVPPPQHPHSDMYVKIDELREHVKNINLVLADIRQRLEV